MVDHTHAPLESKESSGRSSALVGDQQDGGTAVAGLPDSEPLASLGEWSGSVHDEPCTWGGTLHDSDAEQDDFAAAEPYVIRELIGSVAYRRELAAQRGLPPVGTRLASRHGLEYVVIEHDFVLSFAGVARASDGTPAPSLDELHPAVTFPQVSQQLLDLYAEVDRCTCKYLLFYDTMPDTFPCQAAPGLHMVQSMQDPRCITFLLDASRLHETILAHELGHLWIEFVEGCEDWRNLRDQSNVARVVQFQQIQSFVLDLKVNKLLRSRGFDMAVVDSDQQESTREIARHCAMGDVPQTRQAAAGMAVAIAGAMLEQERWPQPAIQEFMDNVAAIRAAQPQLYQLAVQLAASVTRHGYGGREAICRAIDECAMLAFQATGDDFDRDRDLMEIRPTEWYQDKHPGFLRGLPVAAKLEVSRVAARLGLGANLKWQLGVAASGRIDVQLECGDGRLCEPVRLSLGVSPGSSSYSTSTIEPVFPSVPTGTGRHLRSVPIRKPDAPRNNSPVSSTPASPQQGSTSQIAHGSRDGAPGIIRRSYMPGIGLWLSRAGFEARGGSEPPYVYAQNNPVNYADPEGLAPLRSGRAGRPQSTPTPGCPNPPLDGDYAIACSNNAATRISASFVPPDCCNVPTYINFYLSMHLFEAGVSYAGANPTTGRAAGWCAFYNFPGLDRNDPCNLGISSNAPVSMSLNMNKSGKVEFSVNGQLITTSKAKLSGPAQVKLVSAAAFGENQSTVCAHGNATWSNWSVDGATKGVMQPIATVSPKVGGEVVTSQPSSGVFVSYLGKPNKQCR